MNLNKVFIIGRLASDPESRTTTGGQIVTTLRIATNRVWNDRNGQKQEQVEFHTIVAWGGLADIASKYLRKGQMALFEGRMQTRSWQGPDGLKRYRTEIVAESMQLGPKAAGSTGGERFSPPAPSMSRPSQQESKQINDDEIPVINEDAPVTSDPIISDKEVEETEIDLKDIPF